MFIFFSGFGLLVPVIVVIIEVVSTLVFKQIFANEGIGLAIGAFLSAAALWVFGNKMNGADKARLMTDNATGQQVAIVPNHALFFIKIQYWAFLMVAIGLVMSVSLLQGR